MVPITTGCGGADCEGRILRERRMELGMTQEEVALELGISLQQYQRYEYGERKISNCPMRIGLRICALLELEPFEIVRLE